MPACGEDGAGSQGGPTCPGPFRAGWCCASHAGEGVVLVEAAGHKVVGSEWADGRRGWDNVKKLAPDVIVVWTSHLPSDGRTTVAAVRSQPWGRTIPALFVEGDPDLLPKAKRAKLQEVIPDAVLVTPGKLSTWLQKVEAALESKRREF